MDSSRRQQYFQKRTEITLPSGISIQIKYLEIYPEAIGISVLTHTQIELVAIVGKELEKFLGGKKVGEFIDEEGRFTEEVVLKMSNNFINAYAKFELVQEDYIFFIRLIYIA